MSDHDYRIYRRLLDNPDMMHMTIDKKKVYLLNPENKKEMFVVAGDFNGKSKEEINQIVCVATEHH